MYIIQAYMSVYLRTVWNYHSPSSCLLPQYL